MRQLREEKSTGKKQEKAETMEKKAYRHNVNGEQLKYVPFVIISLTLLFLYLTVTTTVFSKFDLSRGTRGNHNLLGFFLPHSLSSHWLLF